LEELENLEETLNDSIKESLGARTGKPSHGKKKGAVEDEEDYIRYANISSMEVETSWEESHACIFFYFEILCSFWSMFDMLA
jgi:hypothetical protein